MSLEFAENFWSRFQRLYSGSDPKKFGSGSGADWTRGMYKLLHTVKSEMSLHCECKILHADQQNTVRGERMHVDFFWYSAQSGDWARPMVVIEHENYEEGALKDFWKVTLLDSPLRVFIGYAATRNGVDALFERLRRAADEHQWRVPLGTADLVILGDYIECSQFRAWVRTADRDWTKLGDASAPQLPIRRASQEKRPWSPNDIVRSVDAYVRVREGHVTLDAAAEELATATGHTSTSARAAIEAVGHVDPENGSGPKPTPFAQAIAAHLLADPKELKRLLAVILTRD